MRAATPVIRVLVQQMVGYKSPCRPRNASSRRAFRAAAGSRTTPSSGAPGCASATAGTSGRAGFGAIACRGGFHGFAPGPRYPLLSRAAAQVDQQVPRAVRQVVVSVSIGIFGVSVGGVGQVGQGPVELAQRREHMHHRARVPAGRPVVQTRRALGEVGAEPLPARHSGAFCSPGSGAPRSPGTPWRSAWRRPGPRTWRRRRT